ncbi:MAG: hypothetical protein OEZ23_05410 [Gammaproteobacteria bacterium]|nr:hypothetical protein [Gammaproteobacteria bacterium]
MQWLLIGAGLFIIVSLLLAWLATAARILQIPSIKSRFPAHDNLVKAHIDYILMALLLFVFYLLNQPLPGWVIGCMLAGGALNPFLFIVVAMSKPDDFRPGRGFMLISMLSFIATTIGFAAAAIIAIANV